MQCLPWHGAIFRCLLQRAERLPHALLLHGRQGIGKAQFARALAQAFLCESQTGASACGSCPACLWFETGSHPDFRLIEPGGARDADDGTAEDRREDAQIVVDQVREIGDFLNLSTHRGGRKVLMLCPAERLNVNAANALLKNLEEPPGRTVFLLVSHRLHCLLPTIKSRCELVALPGPTRDAGAAWLGEQGVANAQLACAHTGESPLLALDLAARDYWQARSDFLRRLQTRDVDPIGTADQVRGLSVSDFLSWLQKWSYDLASQKLLGRIRYNPDCAKSIAALARGLDAVSLLRFHRETVRLQRSVHHPLNAQLFMENALIAYAELVRPAASA